METTRDTCSCLLLFCCTKSILPFPELHPPILNVSIPYFLTVLNFHHEPQIHEELPAYEEATDPIRWLSARWCCHQEWPKRTEMARYDRSSLQFNKGSCELTDLITFGKKHILTLTIFRIQRSSLQTSGMLRLQTLNPDTSILILTLRGANSHLSSTDKGDTQDVISVSLHTKSGTSVGAIHIHLDGTWKLFGTCRESKARHAAKIKSANIPGYISTRSTP